MQDLNPNTDDLRPTKRRAIVYDLVLAVVCLAAIASMLFGKFLTVNISAVLDDEMLSQMTGAQPGTEQDSATFDLSLLSDADRTIDLNVEISTLTLLGSVANGNDEIVRKTLNDQIDHLMLQIKPLVGKVVKIGAKTVISGMMTEWKESLAASVEDADAYLKELGMDAETLSAEVDVIVDELLSDRPDTERVKNEVLDVMDRVGEASGNPLSQETIDSFNEMYDQMVTESLDENGSLDVERLLSRLLNQSGTSPDAGNVAATASETTENDLGTQILANLDETTISTIGLVIRILGILEAVILALWVYLLVKLIAKALFFKNKTVRISVAGIPSFLVFFVLGILPWVLTAFVLPAVGGMPVGVSFLALSVVSMILGAASIVLFVLWLCGYRKLRKQTKAILAAA